MDINRIDKKRVDVLQEMLSFAQVLKTTTYPAGETRETIEAQYEAALFQLHGVDKIGKRLVELDAARLAAIAILEGIGV